jgi:hypothetical protein
LRDRRTGGANPRAEHFEEDAQAIVVKPGRRLENPRRRNVVTRFEHVGEGLGEIRR